MSTTLYIKNMVCDRCKRAVSDTLRQAGLTPESVELGVATVKEAGTPLNAGKIAELSGLDRKEVDKAMKQLKEEGAIVSPVRCKWAPTEA